MKLGPIKTDTERQGAHRVGTSADTSDKVHYWHRQRELGPPNKRGAVVKHIPKWTPLADTYKTWCIGEH